MANGLDFIQERLATAGASDKGRCVRCATGPGEMKGGLRAEGLKPLGEPVKRTELDGIQKGMITQI